MKSKEALEVIRQKEKMINFFKEQRSRSIKSNVGNLGVISEARRQIVEICKRFSKGCGDVFGKTTLNHCAGGLLCYSCQEIKEINDALHAVRETGGKD
jgi:hypothetical protein